MKNIKDHTNRAYARVQSKGSIADFSSRLVPLQIKGFSALICLFLKTYKIRTSGLHWQFDIKNQTEIRCDR